MRNNVAMVLSRVALSTEFENSLVSDLLIDIHNLKKSGGIHHLKVIIDVLCRDLPEVMGVQELSAELVNFILNHPQYSAVFPTSFKVTNHLPTAAGFLNHPQYSAVFPTSISLVFPINTGSWFGICFICP